MSNPLLLSDFLTESYNVGKYLAACVSLANYDVDAAEQTISKPTALIGSEW
jgi:hypothetical protein